MHHSAASQDHPAVRGGGPQDDSLNAEPLAVKKLLPCFSNNKKITTNRIEGGLAVNVKRVSRLMPHVAADALRAFADFQARTAFERPVLTDALREHLPAARIATE